MGARSRLGLDKEADEMVEKYGDAAAIQFQKQKEELHNTKAKQVHKGTGKSRREGQLDAYGRPVSAASPTPMPPSRPATGRSKSARGNSSRVSTRQENRLLHEENAELRARLQSLSTARGSSD